MSALLSALMIPLTSALLLGKTSTPPLSKLPPTATPLSALAEFQSLAS
jgi:hypothetical protein